MMSSGSQSITHLDPPHGRSLSMSGSGSLNTGTPDVGDAKVPAKKKRKKGSPAGETEKEKEKRTKTGRACDACVRPLVCSTLAELMSRGQRKSDVISSLPKMPWAEKRYVRIANSTIWNALSSYRSPRRGSRRRSWLVSACVEDRKGTDG